ncbi:hypothetical protein [Deinococcus alpinitundrae]|uniref:hypothetical protein n=1 Tax=Deinococcus alpinitundrae TaxID=468913 RepID=UPI00137A2A98|nr:hypothetical protein [Deinococcus alpinitundrae]
MNGQAGSVLAKFAHAKDWQGGEQQEQRVARFEHADHDVSAERLGWIVLTALLPKFQPEKIRIW